MTESSADPPVLSAAETRAAESILAVYWGASVTVRAAEKIWNRHHIVRLQIADDDRSVVLKRVREENFGDRARGFDAELAALEFLNAMETGIAPRLFGADWETALAAGWVRSVVARGAGIGRALDQDRNWGTTTFRPRLLTWLDSFTSAASRTGALPRLRSAAEAMHEQLRLRWPDTAVPDYPALARPGATLAHVPEGNEA